MVRLSAISAALALATTILALPAPAPSPLTPDPAGEKNIGNGAGAQFITGACLSNADCASGCCAGFGDGSSGICSGPAASFQQGKTGCGFGSGGGGSAGAPGAGSNAETGNGNAGGSGGAGAGSAAIDTSLPGAQNVGKGDGSQFITGQCLSNADCASTCCNKNTGLCNAIGAIGIENCGFGEA